ncbi:MAG: TonB-dependent receptor [Myxococcales bacterium]|nr:TonB-dependent receptor [Myxococcales bacterium]
MRRTLALALELTAATVPATARAEPPRADTSVAVRGRPRERHEPTQVRLAADEARTVAGTQDDAVRVVHVLPGVSRPALGSSDVIVWGSAPSETRFSIDGVEVPFVFHPSGVRGVVPSDLLGAVELVPGGYGPEYGRGLGGLYRLETHALAKGESGRVAFDTLDGSARVGFGLGPRVRVSLGVRKSWLDAFVRLVSADDVGEVFPVPRYGDAQAKVAIDVSDGETLDVVALGASGATARSVTATDPAVTRTASTHASFGRVYARYTKVTAETTSIVVPFVGRDAASDERSFGVAPAELSRSATVYGVRASTRTRPASWVAFTTGVDVLGTATDVTRRGSLTIPAREGDPNVFGRPPGGDLAEDSFTVHGVDVAPFAHADVRLGPATLSPGLRVDTYLLDGSRSVPPIGQTPPTGLSRLEPALAPRVSARVAVTEALALSASYGLYHEAPRPEDLSAVFGTPELGLAKATHLTFGESLRLAEGVSLEMVVFAKELRDLAVRTRLPSPKLARALTQNGEGRVLGAQWLVRARTSFGLTALVAYTVSRSERRNLEDATFRRFDFDQPHTLSVVVSQTFAGFTFGVRGRASSGYPFTPVVGRTYDALADRYDPVLGGTGTARLPAFFQLDARLDRTFSFGRGATVTAYLDVMNVTAARNVEEMAYSAGFDREAPITGLPTLAIVGARIER